ncbi:uncharacterized protein LOC128135948 [Harpia harpyja]|uniref:uncharacterized protein LOC128135948 n=1 Tax=Harpia harpyja TaxID=202280 RepID=UPI0022B0B487|nr:uncharacterized protein LOC128135948 [Harpia harpyja]
MRGRGPTLPTPGNRKREERPKRPGGPQEFGGDPSHLPPPDHEPVGASGAPPHPPPPQWTPPTPWSTKPAGGVGPEDETPPLLDKMPPLLTETTPLLGKTPPLQAPPPSLPGSPLRRPSPTLAASPRPGDGAYEVVTPHGDPGSTPCLGFNFRIGKPKGPREPPAEWSRV